MQDAEIAGGPARFPWPGAAATCVVMLSALLALHAQTIADLVGTWWNSDDYGHALLVVPICLWLIWRDRRALAALSPRPQWLALALVPVGAAGWFLGDLLAIRVARELSLYLMFVVVVWATLGWRVTWRLAFPLGYLLLSIPVWSVLVPPLQDMTALASTRSLQMMGVPVFLEGHFMHIPHGQFIVEEVCAGLRFLLATMAIVALHARITFHSPWLGSLLFVVGLVSAVVFNWLRVDIIVLAGHLYGMDFWLVQNHIEFGWIMFIVSLLPVLWLSSIMMSIDRPSPPSAAPGAERAPVSRSALAGVCALALASAGPGSAAMVHAGEGAGLGMPPATLPALPRLEGPAPASSGLAPQFQGVDAEREGTYTLDGKAVSVFVAYYAFQRDGKEVVNDLNRHAGEAWTSGGEKVVSTPAVPDAGTARESLVRSVTGETRLLWSWYYVGGRYSTSPIEAKLSQVLDLPLLGGHARGSAVVIISTPVSGTMLAEARAALAGTGAALLPRLEEWLPSADKSS